MKIVEVTFDEWNDLVKKLQECMVANKALNKQIKEYNELAKKHNEKDKK